MTCASLRPSNGATIPRALVLAAFVAFVLLMLRIAAVESPIMASDEYAYFAHAEYAQVAEQLERLDPALQAVENRVYPARSEEHTSELQSLMRISYAVFCLKKKKKKRRK